MARLLGRTNGFVFDYASNAMVAIVPELVLMASDPVVTTTQLLRRALVVASRLGVSEIVSWLNSELNGYKNEVPDYRVIRGQLMVDNPYHGLVPLRVNSNKALEKLTTHQEPQSIPELECVIDKTEGRILRRSFPPEIETKLMRMMEVPLLPQLKFTHVQVNGIIEKVRNRILEWALDLERTGILGEGMTFTQQEKQMVQEQHIHISGVTGSQIQIGSNSSSQSQANQTTGDTAALKCVADALTAALEQSKASGEIADELRAEIATLKAQAASPKPKWEIVKASAKCVKTIVEGAAGSVLGELAKPHVQALMVMLPT